MPLPLSPETERLLRARMARGDFATPDELLREALMALDRQNDLFQAVSEGFADFEAGRSRPLRDMDETLRAKHGIRRGP